MRKNRSLKCVLAWVLCACWLVGAGTCAAAQQGGFDALALKEPGPADIPREAAQQAAMEALVQAGAVRPAAQQGLYDIPMFEMTDVSLAAEAHFVSGSIGGQAQNAWVVTVSDRAHPAVAGSVAIASPSGEVLEMVVGFPTFIKERWEARLGKPQNHWTLEDKQLYGRLYGAQRSDVTYTLPQAGELSSEQALAAAVSALADAYGVSQETLTQERSVAFWFYEDKMRGGRWWRIAFDRYDPQSGAYQEDYYVELNAQDGTVYDLSDGSGMG